MSPTAPEVVPDEARRVVKQVYKFGRDRITLYSRVIGMVVHDLATRFRWTSIVIFATGTLGFLFELGSLLIVLRYAMLLEVGGSVQVFDTAYAARESGELLVMALGSVLVLLLLAAVFKFISGRATMMLREHYEYFAANRAVRHINRLRCVPPVGGQTYLTDGDLTKILRRDTRYGGRIAIMLLGSVLQLVIGVAMLGWLLWVNPMLTGLLVVLVVPAVIMLYRMNVRGARASREMEQRAPEAGRSYRQAVRRLRSSPAPLPDDPDWFDRTLFQQDAIRRFMNAYTARLMATPNAALLANLLFAVAIFAMMLVLGWNILQQGEGWSMAIAYLIGLRFFLDSLRQISARLTSINRFFPQLSRYSSFIQPAATANPLPVGASVDVNVSSDIEPLPGSDSSMTLDRGKPVAMLSPVDLNRFTLAWLLGLLLGRARGRRAAEDAWFIAADSGWIDGSTLREGLGLTEGDQVERFLEALTQLDTDTPCMQFIEQMLDTPLAGEQWMELSDDERARLALARAAVEPCTWLLIDHRVIHAINEPGRKLVQDMFADCFIVHVHHRPSSFAQIPHGSGVLIADEHHLRGIGTVQWAQALQPEISGLFSSPRAGTTNLTDDLDEAEDVE